MAKKAAAAKMPMKGEHMMGGMPMKDAAMKGMMTGKGKKK